MDPDAKECFKTASNLLQQVTGCQPSVAALIVEQIALGTIRWEPDKPGAQHQRNAELFAAWSAGFEARDKLDSNLKDVKQ